MSLAGRVAIVTGASSGIGRATALELARRGARLGLVARRTERLRALAATIEAGGGEALVLPADVAEPAASERIVSGTLARFGAVDVLVDNAGQGLFASVEETTDEDVRRLFEVNVLGAVRLARAVLPAMRRSGRGHIVCVASVVARRALPFVGAYSASKAALAAFAEALRVELRGTGIRVSTVFPAGTATEFFGAAANRLAREPRPVGPVQSAETVARRIARLVERPRPELYPLAGTRLLGVAAALVPGLVDAVIARFAARWERGESAGG